MVECLGAVDLGQQALRDRVESAAPLWEQVGHRSLTLGFESPGAAFTGLTRIVGCVEFCSAMSQGSVMDIRGLGDDLHRAGLAMEQSQQALAISLPGGATLTQESSGYSEVIRCLARKNPVSRCTPGPMLRGRVDQLLEFVSPRSWHVQEARPIASPAALLGRVLRGRYRVDSHLSAGGFGTIFSAVDLETDQDVALKLLHPHLAEKKGVAQAFFNEARACMALDSPFIVRMTDFGHTVDGQLFCVMEHLLGRTLAELSPEARTPDLVIRILLDVLRGLQVVHEADLVHRDIKPSNILVVRGSTGSARGRLIDFGIALHVLEPDPATRPGELVGSAPFISPEQLSGIRPGPAADIYSVGMVFYRSLVGNYPFPDLEPLPQLMRRAAEAAPPLEESSRSALPAGLGELIDRALDRNPALRPRSATEFADELKSILGMPPVDEDSISPD
jgi:hypothetical protein